MKDFKIGDKFLRGYYNLDALNSRAVDNNSIQEFVVVYIVDDGSLILNKRLGGGPDIPYGCILYNEFLMAKKSLSGKFIFKSISCQKDFGFILYQSPLKEKIKKIMQI